MSRGVGSGGCQAGLRWGILAGMDTELTLKHERVDDIPVIMGLAGAMGCWMGIWATTGCSGG